MINTGVMQDFFKSTIFNDIPNAALQLSFVGTLCGAFANFMAPVAQILRSILGTRIVCIIGSLLMALGLCMAGFTSQVSFPVPLSLYTKKLFCIS